MHLIHEISWNKKYRPLVFYQAVFIADKFLATCCDEQVCLLELALVSCLLAAKLEAGYEPSFKRMILLSFNEFAVKPCLANLK